jgi:hypothetical protein
MVVAASKQKRRTKHGSSFSLQANNRFPYRQSQAIVVREEVESFKQRRHKTTLNFLLFFFDFQVIDIIATQLHGCCLRYGFDSDMSLSRHMVVAARSL